MALRIVSGLSATNLTLSSYLDLAKNELRNAQIQNLSTTQIAAISGPVQGQFVYDSTLDKLKVYDGAAWTLVGAAADETTITLSSNTLTIKDGGVSAAKIASSAVTSAKIATGAVTNAKLGADAVTGAKIADNAIDSEHYTDGSIDTVHLADDAVTGAKIAALTVATGNIANLGVTSGKLADGAVGTAKIAADAVTSAKIADGQVDTEHLATDAVTAAKIADNSVDIARLNVTDGSNGQFLQTNGSGTMSFATAIDDSVSATNLTSTLAALDTTHAVNVHGSGSTSIIIGSSTNTPNVQVTGDVIVDGNLTVAGTTTTVNSTTVTIDDPIFTLGGDTAPSADDNKDRGIEFRYHSGTEAHVGFFGYDDSQEAFVFLTDATNTAEVFAGTNGNIIIGQIDIKTASGLKLNNVAVTSTAAELNILDGVTATTSELNILDGVTATATELNIMDGVTSTTAEINKLDGFTGVAADLNYAKDLRATGVTTTEFDKLDGLTASTGELNKLDGATVTTSEINILDGVTATTAEINKLDGVTVSTSEINSVTSRAGRYYHTETSHSGGELQIPSSTHGLTFPFHVTIVDNSGNTLLAEITQASGTDLITIQDLPAETIHVHITGGL
jgi:hypothetical protein